MLRKKKPFVQKKNHLEQNYAGGGGRGRPLHNRKEIRSETEFPAAGKKWGLGMLDKIFFWEKKIVKDIHTQIENPAMKVGQIRG